MCLGIYVLLENEEFAQINFLGNTRMYNWMNQFQFQFQSILAPLAKFAQIVEFLKFPKLVYLNAFLENHLIFPQILTNPNFLSFFHFLSISSIKISIYDELFEFVTPQLKFCMFIKQ